jgi:hypothetical protein
MQYSLFLDDERFPPRKNAVGEWIIARSLDEVKTTIQKHGFPSFVSFDHDLGDGPTGMDVAKYLVDLDMDQGLMPDEFAYYVHSQNPIGAANIRGYLDGYLRIKKI